MYVSPNKELNDQELKATLHLLLKKVVELRPDLKLSDEMKNTIVESMMRSLKAGKKSLTRGDIIQPEFIKNLALVLVPALNNAKNFQEFLTKTLKLFLNKEDQKELAEKLKLSPDQFKEWLKNKLDKEQLKQLHETLYQEIEKSLTLKPGAPKLSPKETKAITDAAYTNIFGIMSTAITGSLQVPVEIFWGNPQLPDLNPHHGTAPVDRMNDPNDSIRGDDLGLNAKVKEHYSAILGNEFADAFKDELHHAGLAPGEQMHKPSPY